MIRDRNLFFKCLFKHILTSFTSMTSAKPQRPMYHAITFILPHIYGLTYELVLLLSTYEQILMLQIDQLYIYYWNQIPINKQELEISEQILPIHVHLQSASQPCSLTRIIVAMCCVTIGSVGNKQLASR